MLVVGLAVALYFWARSGPPSTASADGAAAGGGGGAGPVGAEPEVPRIDLARLDARKVTEPGMGRRDLFDFGVPPTPPPTPPPVTVATPPPFVGPAAPTPPPTPTPLPPLNIRYVGAIEDKRGLKVAVFLTDREEVLTGQAGQLVGNRFRIVRIGLESVDIQEVGSEQTRRIPLGGK
ncbi:MAG: hypothetical protein DMF80_09980 [Acidobacteria bacterium]|nr:MAG: hypothetical protein DMF80_09980 [Acidobacteriota bacterium]PYQ18098.1 MAG: hypothetical protein DMF81_25950 [Acidobacteriota bacterium]